MTISGRVIREITQDELGQIRIGRNITEYAWDGKDEFGDRLANGIYFYKVFTGIEGETIEKKKPKPINISKKDMAKWCSLEIKTTRILQRSSQKMYTRLLVFNIDKF